MKWRRPNLREIVVLQAAIAFLFGYLLVSMFPKVPLLSACIISVVFVMVATLLVHVSIARWRNPEEEEWDFWRNFPDDKDWP